MPNFAKRIASEFSEKFTSVWVLLSETNLFLGRTSVFKDYENQLKAIRQKLSSAPHDDKALHEARNELVELRKTLRLAGYDLTLVSLDISIDGFRNDSCMKDGYRRLVIMIGDHEIAAITGEQNHLELNEMLEMERSRHEFRTVSQHHFLWYKWSNKHLQISGADTETKQAFEELVLWCEHPENRLMLLGRMKSFR